jgi:hypothetical protein
MTDKSKLFVLNICERAMREDGAIAYWAKVTDRNKYGGSFTFYEVSEEENADKSIYKLGYRSVSDVIESIVTDPKIVLPEDSDEMAIMYAYKYKDSRMLEDSHIDQIVQIAVFKEVVYQQ